MRVGLLGILVVMGGCIEQDLRVPVGALDASDPADTAVALAAQDAGIHEDATTTPPDAAGLLDAEASLDAEAAARGDATTSTLGVTPDAATPADASVAGPDATASLAGPDAATSVAGPDAATIAPDASPVVSTPGARVIYSTDRTLSPHTAEVVANLRAIAQRGAGLRGSVFMKVGDSITANSSFMGCFDGDVTGQAPSWQFNILLDGRSELADTILHFRSVDVGGVSPYSRVSAAAQVGASATFPLSGNPAPLDTEYQATLPQYAVIMYGSNDVGLGGSPAYSLVDKLAPYEAAMRQNVDTLIARGVIPVLTTMPPREDDPEYLWIVPTFTAVERAIAQGRQIPLVDFNRELMALPVPHGIGHDGVHPSIQDYNTACWFRAEDLAYGYNVRNLVTIEELHQLDRVFVNGETALDPPAPTMAGTGSPADPFVADSLPFTDMRDTSQSPNSSLQSYSGCAGAPDQPGPEYVYKLVLTRTTALRATVLDQQQNRVALNLLASPTAASCSKFAARMITATLPAGTYFFAVDTLGLDGAEYTFTIVECDPADTRCQ